MPNTNNIIIPRGTLARYPTALPDSRVEQIWDRLKEELHFPHVVEFATYVQPARVVEKAGKLYSKPESIVFLVVSPNPHPRHKGKTIKSFAIVSVEDWYAYEKEKWRHVGVEDAAYPIFKRLCRDHMAARQNMKELIN